MMRHYILLLFLPAVLITSCSKSIDDEIPPEELIGAMILKRDSITNADRKFTEIFFISESIGFVVSTSGGQIFKTEDGGETWDIVYEDPDEVIAYLDFNSGGIGMFVGYKTGRGWRFYRSTDEGVNWNILSTPTADFNFLHWDWVDDTSFVYYGNGGSGSVLLKSIDNGNNSVSASVGPQNPYSEFFFIKMFDELNGIAHGEYDFLKTTDGGMTWTQSITGHSWRDASYRTTDHGVIITDVGAKVTFDGSNDWELVQFKFEDQFTKEINAPFILNQQEVYFGSIEGIYKSNNGGSTIKRINDMKQDNKIYWVKDFFMVDQEIGYAIAEEHFDDTLKSKAGHRIILKTTTGWE